MKAVDLIPLLAEGSAEPLDLAMRLADANVDQVMTALRTLGWLGLVDVHEPPAPCGYDRARWFIPPSKLAYAVELVADPKPWPVFEVRVDGYAEELFTGRTKAAANWRAYRAYSEHRSCSFGEWLAISSIRRIERLPFDDDGYENVRAQYGVSPTIGERRVLVNEGPSSGRGVVVLYPGRHTSMIHCAYDGSGERMIVHPLNAVTLADARWKAWLEAQRAA